MEWIAQPWPWYVSGPLLSGIMLLLLFNGGEFGVSSSLRTLCTLTGAGKKYEFFQFDWRGQIWNLVFLAGAMLGGYLASEFLMGYDIGERIAPDTVAALQALGISEVRGALPAEIMNWEQLFTLKGLGIMVGGGFLIGFGARYAGGCTSGHAISGLSNLQLPSLIAVVGFFIGGLAMTHFFMPLLMK
jgi:hypothetical protein